MQIDMSPRIPLRNRYCRVLACAIGQKERIRACPSTLRLDGKRALAMGWTAEVE